tara:strand:+ start:1730 stop:2116 length:387 start_codon:yes stop_codon:yes gene_type:complete
MAYISAEDVKAIRLELKATFPKFKFGVRKRDWNQVTVTVKEGPTDFSDCFRGDEEYAHVNHYHTHMYGEHKDFFDAIHKIIKTAPIKGEGYWKGKGWYDKSDAMTDYFDTAYYISMNVGEWNKPYVQK